VYLITVIGYVLKSLGHQFIAVHSDFLLPIGEILCYVYTFGFGAHNVIMIQGIGSITFSK